MNSNCKLACVARDRLEGVCWSTAALLITLSLQLGCTADEHTAVLDHAVNPVAAELDFAAFDRVVEALLAQHGLAGASAVVVHADRGIVHLRGYGDFAPDRVFLLASASKMLSAGVLMRLVDRGELDLDAPISRYLAAWGDYKTNITTAQLLSNSSGLVSLVEQPLYAPYLCQYMDSVSLRDCARIIYTADDAADRRAPDSEFRYGGGQWQLAAGIAEVSSGQPWAELIRETYVEACATPSLGYTNQYWRASGGTDVAAGFRYPSFFMADVANLPQTDNPNAEGGAYVTVEDYGKLLLMQLRSGRCDDRRVLSEASVARMQRDRLAAYGGKTSNATFPGYGLGWWIARDGSGVLADPGAYGAVPWLDPTRRYAALVAIESDAPTGLELLAAAKPELDAIFDRASRHSYATQFLSLDP